MRVSLRFCGVALSIAMLIPVCAFSPDPAPAPTADILVTAAPAYVPLAALRGSGPSAERFPQGAQLLRIHQGQAVPLVPGFAASADANVSFDGSQVLFSGKKSPSDPWQIWELTIADGSLRKVIETAIDAERPFYLPGGRMVWAERTPHGFRLQSAEDGHPPDFVPLNPTTGPGLQPLSFLPASAFPADVLADGRILFESGFPLGTGSTPELYLVYADGSGVESYRCDHGTARWGGHQLASGDVVFTHGATLARFTSPLAHEERIPAPRADYAGSLAETEAGDWLLSSRPSPSARYALKLWHPGAAALQTLLALPGKNLVEPVLIAPRPTPKRHPSGLHPWDYANLMALDARLSRSGDLKQLPASVRLEALDAKGHAVTKGAAPIEPDGSFFVKTPADQPIRFSLLDKNGAVLRQEHGWFWIRRGEQRICVGCHTGPERASENHVPTVLLRSTTPIDLTGASPTPQTTPEAPQTGLGLRGGTPGGK